MALFEEKLNEALQKKIISVEQYQQLNNLEHAVTTPKEPSQSDLFCVQQKEKETFAQTQNSTEKIGPLTEELQGKESSSVNPMLLKKISTFFGPYQIIRPLARGGMGFIYLVRHKEQHKEYALKMLTDHYDQNALQRFSNEAKLVSSLKHPGIVSVYDYGEKDGVPYLVMDLIEGDSLAHLIKQHGPFPLKKSLRMMIQICLALDYAHSHGVIHRDIKPDNILLEKNGNPKIVDFGLAKNVKLDRETQKLTQTGQILGTPAYMAPEAVSGETKRISPGLDIYGLGVTLYELLTGKLPFASQNSLTLLNQILSQSPMPPRVYNPSIPAQVETIILKCLNKNSDFRYTSAQDLGKDISRYLSDIPIEGKHSSLFKKSSFWLLRYWFLFFILFSLLYFWRLNSYHQEALQNLELKHKKSFEQQITQQTKTETLLTFERRNLFVQFLKQQKEAEEFTQKQQQLLMEKQKNLQELRQKDETLDLLKERLKKAQQEQEKLQENFHQTIAQVYIYLQEMDLDLTLFFLQKFNKSGVPLKELCEAVSYEKQQKWRKALESFMQIPPPFHIVAQWKAFEISLEPLADLTNADKILKKLTAKEPSHPLTLQAKVSYLYATKEYQELSKTITTMKTSFHFSSRIFYLSALLDCDLLNHRPLETWRPVINRTQGLQKIERAIQLNPHQPSYVFAQGLILLQEGKVQQALESFKRVLEMKPSVEVHTFLAACYIYLKQFKQAQVFLNKALTEAPEYEIAIYYQGVLQLQEQDSPLIALATFEKVVQLLQTKLTQQKFKFPGHQIFLLQLIPQLQSHQGRILLHSGQWQKASWLFDQLLKADSNSQTGLIGIGKILLYQGNSEQAIDYFKKASVSLKKKTPETYIWNGFYYLHHKRLKQVKKILSKIEWLETIPTSLLFLKEFAELNAENLKVDLNQINPTDRLWCEALILYFRGQDSLEKVWIHTRNPAQKAKAYFYLGMLEKLIVNGDPKKAQSYFERSFALQQIALEEHFMAWIELGGKGFKE